MRTKGKISSWNDEKGYGFIEPLGGGKRLFIHIYAFSNRNRRPEVNQIVTYALSTDNKGRPCAVKATLAGDRLARNTKKSSGTLAIAAAIIFLTGV
ncbi:MAG: cold shock domain-containing protein, partial [Candidatus Sedimenticola sp. (ex Thyasira tokunagai)]